MADANLNDGAAGSESARPASTGPTRARPAAYDGTPQARHPLERPDCEIGDFHLSQIVDHALVSVAFQYRDHHDVEAAVRDAYGVPAMPGIGETILSRDELRLLRLQQDQLWLWWPAVEPAADRIVKARLGEAPVCFCDQSDGWAAFALEGQAVMAVLERLCPVDLHSSVFPVDTVARTVMEHLGVILVRTAAGRFDVLTPRSSAESFVHAIRSTAAHVAAERDLRQS